MNKHPLFRMIPRMDMLLTQDAIQELIAQYGYDHVREVLRQELENLRVFIAQCEEETYEQIEREIVQQTEHLPEKTGEMLRRGQSPTMRRVLNGTGVILHTNLGRAPIAEELLQEAVCAAGGYSNLEYDLQRGMRGNRGEAIEKLLCEITGAEAALVVNNNAAAVLLVLHALAKGGEAIVSRGELVEIGGHFRIPDVMELSGARLREVGTTNKTCLEDYARAITEETKVILKVHTSNYRIVGFTESVDVKALRSINQQDQLPIEGARDQQDQLPIEEARGQQGQLPIVEDLGSGALIDLSQYGLPGEPVVKEALNNGADVVCFSGDKLLGGPQAGIILGKKCYIDRMRQNPFYRAMRIDKFTAAVLERTLLCYRSEEVAKRRIPLLRMISKSIEELTADAEEWMELLEQAGVQASMEVYSCASQVGGGSLPLTSMPSVAVAFSPKGCSVEEFERQMRALPLPVVGRIEKGKFLIDMRTFEMRYARESAKQMGEAFA